MEIHSADAGINTDSDSNNARRNKLYVKKKKART